MRAILGLAVCVGIPPILAACGGGSPTPPSCTYTLQSAASVSFDSAGGTGAIRVSTGSSCQWNVDVGALAEDWVKVSTATQTGSGQASFTVLSAAALPQVPLPRSGPLYVYSAPAGTKVLTIQVDQR